MARKPTVCNIFLEDFFRKLLYSPFLRFWKVNCSEIQLNSKKGVMIGTAESAERTGRRLTSVLLPLLVVRNGIARQHARKGIFRR